VILVDWLAAAISCRLSNAPLTVESARVMPYSGFLSCRFGRAERPLEFILRQRTCRRLASNFGPVLSGLFNRSGTTVRPRAQNSLILYLEQAMSYRVLLLAALITSCAAGLCSAQSLTPIPKIAVTTYHYDNLRTGWNSQERILNPTSDPMPAPTARLRRRKVWTGQGGFAR
jgi:hypothetical protein